MPREIKVPKAILTIEMELNNLNIDIEDAASRLENAIRNNWGPFTSFILMILKATTASTYEFRKLSIDKENK